MSSLFLNLSYTSNATPLPNWSLIISFREVKDDIRIKAEGLYIDAISVAGPVPIDLPKRIILLGSTSYILVRYSIR